MHLGVTGASPETFVHVYSFSDHIPSVNDILRPVKKILKKQSAGSPYGGTSTGSGFSFKSVADEDSVDFAIRG